MTDTTIGGIVYLIARLLVLFLGGFAAGSPDHPLVSELSNDPKVIAAVTAAIWAVMWWLAKKFKALT